MTLLWWLLSTPANSKHITGSCKVLKTTTGICYVFRRQAIAAHRPYRACSTCLLKVNLSIVQTALPF